MRQTNKKFTCLLFKQNKSHVVARKLRPGLTEVTTDTTDHY